MVHRSPPRAARNLPATPSLYVGRAVGGRCGGSLGAQSDQAIISGETAAALAGLGGEMAVYVASFAGLTGGLAIFGGALATYGGL